MGAAADDLPAALLDRPLQTFILSGNTAHDFGGTCRFAPQAAYGLWQILSGMAHCQGQHSDDVHRLSPGTVFLTHPHEALRITVPQATRFRRLVFAIVPSPRQRQTGGRGASGQRTQALVVPAGSQPDSAEIFGQRLPFLITDAALRRAADEVLDTACADWWRGTLARLRASHLLHGWLLAALAHHAETEMAGDHPPAELMRLIERHLHEGLDVDQLARRCGLSVRQLRRRVQRWHDCAPQQLIDAVRRRRAAELLRGRHRIASVAARCGFADVSGFGRWFRRHFATTPTAWQQRQSGRWQATAPRE